MLEGVQVGHFGPRVVEVGRLQIDVVERGSDYFLNFGIADLVYAAASDCVALQSCVYSFEAEVAVLK